MNQDSCSIEKNNSRIIQKRLLRKKILISFLFFVIVFQPAIIRVSMSYLAIPLMLGYVLLSVISKKILVISHSVISIIKGFIPFIIYFYFISIIRLFLDFEYYYPLVSQTSLSIIFILVSIVFLISFSRKNYDLKLYDYFDIFIFVAFIQLVLVVLGFIFPSVQTFFNQLTINNTKNDITASNILKYSYRTYGLSGYYYDFLGYIISFMIVICFIRGVETKKSILIIFSFLLLFIPLVNSRTGILLSFVCFAIILVRYFAKGEIRRNLKTTITIVLAISIAIFVLSQISEFFSQWISEGFTQVINLLKGDTTKGVFSQIVDKDWVVPQDNFFFGIGIKPENAGIYAKDRSAIDSGVIQSLWRFGFIGLLLLFIGYFHMFINVFKSSNKQICKTLMICFTVIVSMYYFKTYPIMLHGANFIVFGIPTLILCNRDKEIEFGEAQNICNNGNI